MEPQKEDLNVIIVTEEGLFHIPENSHLSTNYYYHTNTTPFLTKNQTKTKKM